MSLANLHARAGTVASRVEQNIVPFLVLLALFYVAVTAKLAHIRLMWTDELFTAFITSHGPWAAWSGIAPTTAPMPPTFYMVSSLCERLPVANNFSLRLPEMVGVFVASVCLFLFVRRHTNSIYGVIAVLTLWVTRGYTYAYEARPYGIVLGFCALALLCWQAAAEGIHRRWALAGLFAACAGALASHYGGILILFPLGVGELTRTVVRKKLDWPVWLAFCGAFLPIVIFWRLIGASVRPHGAAMWSRPTWTSGLHPYRLLLISAGLPLAAAFCAAILWQASNPAPSGAIPRTSGSMPRYEIAAAIALLLLPLLGLVQAYLITGQITPRYVLPLVIGFSILIAVGSFHVFGGDPSNGVLIALVLFAGWGFNVLYQYDDAAHGRHVLANFTAMAQKQQSLPISIPDGHLFLVLQYYSPKNVSERLLYLDDPSMAQRYLGKDTLDVDLLSYSKLVPLNVRNFASFIETSIKTSQPFLFYRADPLWDWAFPVLQERGAHFELAQTTADGLLFQVHVK